MALTTTPVRPTATIRRFGYGIAIFLNAAALAAVNIWPGWHVVPFLTPDMALVLPLVNASIISSLIADAVYLVDDAPWLRELGNLVTTAIGAVALVRMWQVFPFDFADAAVDWAFVVRTLIVLGVAGSVIAITVSIAAKLRAALSPQVTEHHP